MLEGLSTELRPPESLWELFVEFMGFLHAYGLCPVCKKETRMDMLGRAGG